MARISCGTWFLFACLTAAGQELCHQSPEQQDFFADKHRVNVAAAGPRLGTLAAEFQGKLADHPGDARYLFLYGRSLMGKDTKLAIEQLNTAVAASPKMPWSYLALGEIYINRKFHDPEKAAANFRTFRMLCPDTLEGYQNLDKLTIDASESREIAKRLRALLEPRSEPADGKYWRLLWTAEFRATAQDEYPELRRRVAQDVTRLEKLDGGGKRAARSAFIEGYKLSGNNEAADRLSRADSSDTEWRQEYDAWIAKTGVRARNLTEAERAEFNKEYLRVSGEWVKRWPESLSAWDTYAMMLASSPDSSKQEVEHAGEQVLHLEALREWGWTYLSLKLRVAQYWLRKGIRPADCVRLAEEALAQAMLGPADANDMTGSSATRSFSFDSAVWEAMSAVVEGAIQLRNFDKARAMVERMQKWVDENVAKKDDPTTGYTRFQGRYYHYAGALAESEGRKTDAVGLYLMQLPYGRMPGELERTRQLWTEAGGTREAFDLLSHRPPPPPPSAPKPPAANPTAATEFAAWKEFGKSLGGIGLRDLAGRTWTIADFQGKATLVNSWATWCGPCWEELPQIQKLYEMLQARSDLQLVTISIDDNPGAVEPFLKSKGYTFPVLMLGQSFVEQLTGPITIPRNWVVDPKGVARLESIGFDSKIKDWTGDMVKRLEVFR